MLKKKKYRSLLHCCSRSENVYKSTVETPEQGEVDKSLLQAETLSPS